MAKLYVFVEGPDDELLMKTVLEKCQSAHRHLFYRYSTTNSESTQLMVEKLKEDKDHYVMFADLDDFTSITARKKQRADRYGVEVEKVFVVKTEIESWYAAGAKQTIFNSKGHRSEEITKQKFDQLTGSRARHTSIMEEIADGFDTNKAIQSNKSFKYFYNQIKELLQKIGTFSEVN